MVPDCFPRWQGHFLVPQLHIRYCIIRIHTNAWWQTKPPSFNEETEVQGGKGPKILESVTEGARTLILFHLCCSIQLFLAMKQTTPTFGSFKVCRLFILLINLQFRQGLEGKAGFCSMQCHLGLLDKGPERSISKMTHRCQVGAGCQGVLGWG